MHLFDHAPQPQARTPWRDRLILAAVGLLGLWWFHAVDFASGFTAISGDTGDTRLVAFLLEHGWQALQGKASLASPPMFFPVQGTFGYADAFLLQGLIFWPLRALGAEPLTALQWATLLLNGLNYVAMAWLLHKVLRLGAVPSAFGAALLAYNSAKFNQFAHVQLQPLVLLPLMVALGIQLARQEHWTPRQAFWRLAALALLLNVKLLTGVYVAWFFCFWVLLFLACLLLFAPSRHWLLRMLMTWRLAIAGAGVVFLVGAVPFALLYVPVLRQTGWRTFGDAQGMIPHWFSLFMMGDTNFLWAWVERAIPDLEHMPFYWEHRIGLGLVVTVAWLALAVLAVQSARGLPVRSDGHAQGRPPARVFLIALVLSVTAYYLLGMKYFGHSPWWFAFHTVPGIKSVRAVARYVIVVALPLGIGLAYALDALLAQAREAHKPWQVAALTGLAALALVEQVGTRQGYDKAREWARLQRLAAQVPDDCAAFYLTSRADSTLSLPELQIDAMFAAQLRGIPTLNGYSGQDPKDWGLFQVREPGYEDRVHAWVQQRKVQGKVCAVADPD